MEYKTNMEPDNTSMDDAQGGMEDVDLNPTNAFGEILLDLLEAQYDGDLNAGIEALTQALSTLELTEEDVIAIIQGDAIVDDIRVLEAIVQALPDADENDLEALVEVAKGVEEEDRNGLEDSLEGEESPEEGTPEDTNEAVYSNKNDMTNFSGNLAAEFAALKAEHDQMKAQFAANTGYAAISATLSEIDNRLSHLVAEQVLPPSIKTALIGNFSSPTQRVATFTEIAKANGARDLQEQVFAINFAMSLLTDAANVVEFTDYAVTPEEEAMAQFSASSASLAQQDFDALGLDLTAYVV